MAITYTQAKFNISYGQTGFNISYAQAKFNISLGAQFIPHAGGIGFWRIETEFEVQ